MRDWIRGQLAVEGPFVPFVLTDGVRYNLRNGYVTSPMRDGTALVNGREYSWDADGECKFDAGYEIVGVCE
jgi:hypothetical protein